MTGVLSRDGRGRFDPRRRPCGGRKEDLNTSWGGGPKGGEEENQEAHQLPSRLESISKPVPHLDPPSLLTQQEPTLSLVCQPPGLSSPFISCAKLLNAVQSSQCKDAGICEQRMGLCLHCMAQASGNLRPGVSPGQDIWEGSQSSLLSPGAPLSQRLASPLLTN